MGGINPMAFAAMAAAQDPTKWGPLLDAMQIPLPGTPEFMQLTGNAGPGNMPTPDIGAELNMAPNTDPMTSAMPLPPPGPQMPAAPMAEPLGPEAAVPPPGQAPPSLTPTPPPTQTGRGSVTPQVKAPDASAARPIMSGGVSGAQKAPDFGGKATLQTPAQMMMAALLNRGQPTQVAPTLGSILRGGRY